MSDYQCPKCGGTDYFNGKRNVSGAFFKILRTKEVPICKKCDEIMVSTLKLNPKFMYIIAGVLLLLLVFQLIVN